MFVEIKKQEGKNPRMYKDETYVEQEAALFSEGSVYPLPFKLNRKQSDLLTPGRYQIDRDSFSTDQHGNLRLGRVKLVQVKA